jgi:hypothetical protein
MTSGVVTLPNSNGRSWARSAGHQQPVGTASRCDPGGPRRHRLKATGLPPPQVVQAGAWKPPSPPRPPPPPPPPRPPNPSPANPDPASPPSPPWRPCRNRASPDRASPSSPPRRASRSRASPDPASPSSPPRRVSRSRASPDPASPSSPPRRASRSRASPDPASPSSPSGSRCDRAPPRPVRPRGAFRRPVAHAARALGKVSGATPKELALLRPARQAANRRAKPLRNVEFRAAGCEGRSNT